MKINKTLKNATSAIALSATIAVGTVGATQAEEDFTVTMISVSVYGPWFIAKEMGMADGINIDIKIIEDITARNAGISTGVIQCMMTTMDSTVVTAAAGLPVQHVAVPLMSYGLDEMVVDGSIKSEADIAGKTYAADYGFLNHMWMLLTLKKNGIPLDGATHSIMLPQDATAAFSSGALDIDVNFIPFSTQSAEREGAYVLKSTFTDKTYERGLVSDSIACNSQWLEEKPEVANEVIRAWFQAVDWWKQNPAEGNAIIARGLDWPEEDVRLTQAGAIMLNINQNMGALGLPGGKPLCASIPEEAPQPDGKPSGWGELVGSDVDCEPGYLADTWNLFSDVYREAGVADVTISAEEGVNSSIIEKLDADGFDETYSNNSWVGRLPI